MQKREKIVRLLTKVSIPGGPCYNVNERLSFDEDIAQDLIDNGAAVEVTDKQLLNPPKDKMIEAPQTQKGARSKERARVTL